MSIFSMSTQNPFSLVSLGDAYTEQLHATSNGGQVNTKYGFMPFLDTGNTYSDVFAGLYDYNTEEYIDIDSHMLWDKDPCWSVGNILINSSWGYNSTCVLMHTHENGSMRLIPDLPDNCFIEIYFDIIDSDSHVATNSSLAKIKINGVDTDRGLYTPSWIYIYKNNDMGIIGSNSVWGHGGYLVNYPFEQYSSDSIRYDISRSYKHGVCIDLSSGLEIEVTNIQSGVTVIIYSVKIYKNVINIDNANKDTLISPINTAIPMHLCIPFDGYGPPPKFQITFDEPYSYAADGYLDTIDEDTGQCSQQWHWEKDLSETAVDAYGMPAVTNIRLLSLPNRSMMKMCNGSRESADELNLEVPTEGPAGDKVWWYVEWNSDDCDFNVVYQYSPFPSSPWDYIHYNFYLPTNISHADVFEGDLRTIVIDDTQNWTQQQYSNLIPSGLCEYYTQITDYNCFPIYLAFDVDSITVQSTFNSYSASFNYAAGFTSYNQWGKQVQCQYETRFYQFANPEYLSSTIEPFIYVSRGGSEPEIFACSDIPMSLQDFNQLMSSKYAGWNHTSIYGPSYLRYHDLSEDNPSIVETTVYQQPLYLGQGDGFLASPVALTGTSLSHRWQDNYYDISALRSYNENNIYMYGGAYVRDGQIYDNTEVLSTIPLQNLNNGVYSCYYDANNQIQLASGDLPISIDYQPIFAMIVLHGICPAYNQDANRYTSSYVYNTHSNNSITDRQLITYTDIYYQTLNNPYSTDVYYNKHECIQADIIFSRYIQNYGFEVLIPLDEVSCFYLEEQETEIQCSSPLIFNIPGKTSYCMPSQNLEYFDQNNFFYWRLQQSTYFYGAMRNYLDWIVPILELNNVIIDFRTKNFAHRDGFSVNTNKYYHVYFTNITYDIWDYLQAYEGGGQHFYDTFRSSNHLLVIDDDSSTCIDDNMFLLPICTIKFTDDSYTITDERNIVSPVELHGFEKVPYTTHNRNDNLKMYISNHGTYGLFEIEEDPRTSLTSYVFYVRGKRFEKRGYDSIQFDNSFNGMWHVYYDSDGELQICSGGYFEDSSVVHVCSFTYQRKYALTLKDQGKIMDNLYQKPMFFNRDNIDIVLNDYSAPSLGGNTCRVTSLN